MCWPTRRAGVAQHVRLQRLAGTYVWYVVHLSGQACGWVPDGVATQLAWRLAHNNWLSATISVITAISHYFQNIRDKTAPTNKAKTDHCTTVKTPNPVLISLLTINGTSFMTVTESHLPSM